MHWRAGRIVGERARWTGAIEYDATIDDGDAVRALGYPDIVGELAPGAKVLLNTSALQRGLGTGGLALIVAAPDALPDDPHGPGHIVKARYTPQQQMFLAIDEQDSPHHATLTAGAAADGDLLGMPVVVADLHSALPAVVAGIRLHDPTLKVGYIMTDGGALPLAFSRTVATLVEQDWLAATITVGQAYGGQHEAVTLHSGLLAAKHALGLDVVVVCQGPGNVGTGTPWGFSGVAAGEALTAVWTLGGHGIGSLRVSDSDARGRHHGISHHSLTAYGRVALGAFDVPYASPGNDFERSVAAQVSQLVGGAAARITPVAVPTDGIAEALASTPVRLSTMGRGLDIDPAPFVAAAVAGLHSATLLN